MNKRQVAYVFLALIAITAGTSGGYVAGKLSVLHDPNADPYRYCFKVHIGANNTIFGFPFGPLIPFNVPPGYYAICRLE